jgi:hypothetical protein
MNVKRLFLIFILAVFCNACSTMQPRDIRELVMKASEYSGRIVVVDGCFMRDLDMIALGPCSMPSDDEPVWFTTYTELEGQSKYITGILKGLQKPDETLSEKDKQLEEQLINAPQGVLIKVRLRGEFRFSATPQFGNNKYKYELIVHRVMDIQKNR